LLLSRKKNCLAEILTSMNETVVEMAESGTSHTLSEGSGFWCLRGQRKRKKNVSTALVQMEE
jgi:hypothetical protein